MNHATLLPVVFLLAACGEGGGRPAADPPATSATAVAATEIAPANVPHGLDPASVARGGVIYRQHCASCHGDRAQGAPNWQRPGSDGKYPAPPLNGSAHDWHHPKAVLVRIIKDGTAKLGGNMPAWRDKLSDGEIEAIIGWLQSLWPEEIYGTWKRMDDQASQKQRGS